MKTKNLYFYPISNSNIKGISKLSPAHKLYKIDNCEYDLREAVDFRCDLDTSVRAALDGAVTTVVDNLKLNYNKPEFPKHMDAFKQLGNFVVIKHNNREFSIYAHFKYKRVKVKPGQEVKTGQIIGYSGHTGWSLRPHLHFMVFKWLKPFPARDYKSLDIRWKTKSSR